MLDQFMLSSGIYLAPNIVVPHELQLFKSLYNIESL